jgi:hypothetical protein
MRRRTPLFTLLALLGCSVSASAETLHCQSLNGNLNCTGSNGVSCQTVDGRKVCVSGRGDVVQSFGADTSSRDRPAHDDARTDDEDIDAPVLHQRVELHGRDGHTLLLQRDGTQLHLQTDRLSLDRD